MVYTVTEVKQHKVLGVLKDDRIATLKKFLSKADAAGRIPKEAGPDTKEDIPGG
jgi:hypothetical protein